MQYSLYWEILNGLIFKIVIKMISGVQVCLLEFVNQFEQFHEHYSLYLPAQLASYSYNSTTVTWDTYNIEQ